jgi:hypothetical protein
MGCGWIYHAGTEAPAAGTHDVHFKMFCTFADAAGWVAYTKPQPQFPPAQQGFIGCAGRSNDTKLLNNVRAFGPSGCEQCEQCEQWEQWEQC